MRVSNLRSTPHISIILAARETDPVRIYHYSHLTSLTRCQTIGAARSYFMNVWSLGTSASPLTAIELIPVVPECLRPFLTKQYKQDKTLGSTHPSSLGDSLQRSVALLPDSEIFSALPISPSVWRRERLIL